MSISKRATRQLLAASAIAVAAVLPLTPAMGILFDVQGYWGTYIYGGIGSIETIGTSVVAGEDGWPINPSAKGSTKVTMGMIRYVEVWDPGKSGDMKACNHRALRMICTWDNSKNSVSRCNAHRDEWIAAHGKKANEKWVDGADFFEICYPNADVEAPTPTPTSDNSKVQYGMDVKPAASGEYSRDGSNLRAGQSDDLTGEH